MFWPWRGGGGGDGGNSALVSCTTGANSVVVASREGGLDTNGFCIASPVLAFGPGRRTGGLVDDDAGNPWEKSLRSWTSSAASSQGLQTPL